MIYRRFRNIALFIFEICALKIYRNNRVAYFRGVAMEAMSLPPHFNFRTKKRSNIFSFKNQRYCFLWVFRNSQKDNGQSRIQMWIQMDPNVARPNRPCHKNWTYWNVSLKSSTIKDQKSSYVISLDLRKDCSNLRENFVSHPQLNMI